MSFPGIPRQFETRFPDYFADVNEKHMVTCFVDVQKKQLDEAVVNQHISMFLDDVSYKEFDSKAQKCLNSKSHQCIPDLRTWDRKCLHAKIYPVPGQRQFFVRFWHHRSILSRMNRCLHKFCMGDSSGCLNMDRGFMAKFISREPTRIFCRTDDNGRILHSHIFSKGPDVKRIGLSVSQYIHPDLRIHILNYLAALQDFPAYRLKRFPVYNYNGSEYEIGVYRMCNDDLFYYGERRPFTCSF